MNYFEHVRPKTEVQPNPSEVSPYLSMVERVEQRAYAMLEREDQQVTAYASVDPFADLSPDDSDLWITALTKAREMDKELYARRRDEAGA